LSPQDALSLCETHLLAARQMPRRRIDGEELPPATQLRPRLGSCRQIYHEDAMGIARAQPILRTQIIRQVAEP
jgi:hypothetical protein